MARPEIHATAELAPDVRIGDDTRVWHYAHIREGAVIGTGCILGKGVYVDAGVVIGDHCKLQNGVAVYRPTVVEDGVFLGPGVIVTNDRRPRAVNPDLSLKRDDDWTATPVLIRAGAAVGAASVVVAGVTIGRWSLVGAGSVVTRDVPDHGLAVGSPARLTGYVCACGAGLEGDPRAARQTCRACGRSTDLGG